MFWWNATAPQTSNDTQMQMCRKLVMILKRKSETGTELPYAFCLRMMVLFSFSSMTAKFVEPSRFKKKTEFSFHGAGSRNALRRFTRLC